MEAVQNFVLFTAHDVIGVNLASMLLFIALVTFVVIDVSDYGIRASLKHIWFKLRSNEKRYIEKILFFSYAYFLARITILTRDYLPNPLSKVFNGGWIISVDQLGDWDFDPINNIFLLMPYVFFMLMAFPKIILGKSFRCVLLRSALIALCATVFIETTQLIFSIGTFQLADMVYNTIGGTIGGALYYALNKLKKSKKQSPKS